MKIILLIIFFSGSRAAVFDWKQSYYQCLEYYKALRRGFNPVDYLHPAITCTCGKCKNLTGDDLLTRQKEAHNEMMKDLREQIIVNVMHTIFSTGIVIAALYYYLLLTLNN